MTWRFTICFESLYNYIFGYESFLCFLQSFIHCMEGRQPETIVTDLDSELRDAIANEMPNTKHVICLWKILPKLSSWFSTPLGVQYAEFKSEFDIISQLENVDEFEHQWNHLVARYGLGSDKHIALLFAYRMSWPISYIRNFFLAHSMTPEYSKLVETFLKHILSEQSNLQLFFEQVSMIFIFYFSILSNNLVLPSPRDLFFRSVFPSAL